MTSMSTTEGELLVVRDLAVRYGTISVVKGLSLTVGPGESVVVVGPNGVGKSTLLKAISGAIPSAAGSISFCGRSIRGRRPDQILHRGLSHILEGRQIFASLTIQENLELGATVRRRDKSWRQDLEMFYDYFPILSERRKSLASQLSGGQQQMLAIARGFVSRPKLVLLDEPSMGLSPVMVEQLGSIIRWARETFHTSVLLVEQNSALAFDVADRGYVMVGGRFVHSGSTSELADEDLLRDLFFGSATRDPASLKRPVPSSQLSTSRACSGDPS